MPVPKTLTDRATQTQLQAFLAASTLTVVGGLANPVPAAYGQASAISQDPSRLLIVDCLLPGQVRKLGGQMTYLSPRRAVKTTAVDCEIRGGEYVAYDRANYATALQVWMPQAEGGDAQAQVYVGEIFEKGLGRPADYSEAAKWYQKAAAQNFPRGQMNLAYFYEQGLGVEKDPLKALNLYRLATGISDDSLILASEATEVRSEMQRTIDGLTEQLETKNTEVLQLKADLDASQSKLASQRSALARAQGEARDLEQQVAQLRSQAPTDPTRVAELQKLERELSAREQRLLQEERAVANIEADTASMRARLADQMREAAERDLALRNELVQATQARDELQQKLVQTQRQLLDTEQKAAQLRARLTSEQAKIAADREALARQVPAPSSGLSDERRREMTAELAERESSLAAQQKQIATLLEQQRTYTAELTRLRSELAARGKGDGESQAQVAAARADLATTQRKLSDTEREVAQLKAQIDAERSQAAIDRQRLASQASATSTAAQKQRQQMTAELAASEKRIADQQTRISALEQQQRNYSAELARLRASQPGPGQAQQQAQLASTRSELASTQRRLVETEQRVADLSAQLEAERRSIATEREQLSRRAASATAAQQVEIDRLRKALLAREADLNKQQALIASLQAESKAYQQQVQRLQSLPVERVAMRGTGQAATAGLPATKVPRELRIGRYHALVIGNNRYENLPNLETAVPDAQAVADVLQSRYGFSTRVLLNATRVQILAALNDYRKDLGNDDSLLIYYAGHGDIDQKTLRGYWQPVNAQRDDTTEWISDQSITEQIGTMSARHVLVVADSCYSGAMVRGGGATLRSSGSTDAEIKRLMRLARMPSRTVLTSGGEQPVLDTGGGGHSIFARALLQVLRTNDNVLDGTSLYNLLFDEVRASAARYKVEQSPRYNAIADAGHRQGEFLFIPAT